MVRLSNNRFQIVAMIQASGVLTPKASGRQAPGHRRAGNLPDAIQLDSTGRQPRLDAHGIDRAKERAGNPQGFRPVNRERTS
jgi:hypothetical protein